MPRDTNGNTQPLPGTIVANGDTILPSQHNPALVDLYAMMTQSLSRDGQGGMRANLDMSGFRVINVAAGTLPGDAVSVEQLQNGIPVGSVLDYAGASAPDTWMFCFGQAISRATYPDLFLAISTAYGAGNGTTTFNLPDARGRVVAGKDNMGGSSANRLTSPINGDVLGASGGDQGHVLTIAQMPSHFHGGTTTSNGGFVQTILNVVREGFGNFSFPGGGNAGFNSPTITGPSHVHGIPPDGGSQSHNNMQPTIVMNKIIKVSY